MSNLDSLHALVNQYAAEDFVSQRRRLREARMKWIDEHECPTQYSITTRNPETGKEVTVNTPFQIGKLKYDGEWHEGLKQPVVHDDPAGAAALLDGIDAIIKDAEIPSNQEQRLTILVSGNEQNAFVTGGDAEHSPHPPIMEGEDYGTYYARVSRAYERATGTGDGRPASGDDSLRQSATIDPAAVRRTPEPGSVSGGSDRASLGGEPIGSSPGDTGQR